MDKLFYPEFFSAGDVTSNKAGLWRSSAPITGGSAVIIYAKLSEKVVSITTVKVALFSIDYYITEIDNQHI